MGPDEGDRYGGVFEDQRGTRFGEEAAEVVGVGFAGGEHGGADEDGVGRGGEGRVGGWGEVEREGGGGERGEDGERVGEGEIGGVGGGERNGDGHGVHEVG